MNAGQAIAAIKAKHEAGQRTFMVGLNGNRATGPFPRDVAIAYVMMHGARGARIEVN